MLGHPAILMAQQQLRVGQIASICRSLSTNISKLEIPFVQRASLVKARAQGTLSQGLPVFFPGLCNR